MYGLSEFSDLYIVSTYQGEDIMPLIEINSKRSCRILIKISCGG